MNDDIFGTLQFVYGDQAPALLAQLQAFLQTHEPPEPTPTPHWYYGLHMYTVYPDGVIYDAKYSALQNLAHHLSKIKQLGCNTVHILPFLASPMKDKGFDIADFYAIRPELGNYEDLQNLIIKAKQLNLHLVMDLVLNHVSDQHEWFIKAENGDAYYRQFFIHTNETPKFIHKFYHEQAIWAAYEAEGKNFIANIIFPEHTGPIPHWRLGKDGYWYYHTFYPEQLDLNWLNPQVFLEVAKIVIHWAKLGFNFRLDAIHFIGKGPYKVFADENCNAYALITVLKWLAKQVNPSIVFIIEACEETAQVIPYFGKTPGSQADMAYSFHSCNELWLSMIQQDPESLWEEFDQFKLIPSHAEWLYFLRNHDELSLAYLNEQESQVVSEAIARYGMDFREGCGISGRTYSLLAENTLRFVMAYFFLASLPGSIMLPYGDEIAKKNSSLCGLAKILQRDTRNINRGVVYAHEYEEPCARTLFKTLSNIFNQRAALRPYFRVWPERLSQAPAGVFAARYKLKHNTLMVYINLTADCKEIEIINTRPLISINEVIHRKSKTILGPYAGVWLRQKTSSS